MLLYIPTAGLRGYGNILRSRMGTNIEISNGEVLVLVQNNVSRRVVDGSKVICVWRGPCGSWRLEMRAAGNFVLLNYYSRHRTHSARAASITRRVPSTLTRYIASFGAPWISAAVSMMQLGLLFQWTSGYYDIHGAKTLQHTSLVARARSSLFVMSPKNTLTRGSGSAEGAISKTATAVSPRSRSSRTIWLPRKPFPPMTR